MSLSFTFLFLYLQFTLPLYPPVLFSCSCYSSFYICYFSSSHLYLFPLYSSYLFLSFLDLFLSHLSGYLYIPYAFQTSMFSVPFYLYFLLFILFVVYNISALSPCLCLIRFSLLFFFLSSLSILLLFLSLLPGPFPPTLPAHRG